MTKYVKIAAICAFVIFLVPIIILLRYYGASQMLSDIFTAGQDLYNNLVYGEHPGPKVSRVKSDMRSLATALEAYYIDHTSYPVKISLLQMQIDPLHIAQIGGTNLFTIEPGKPGGVYGITTPVAYITSIIGDPCTAKPRPRFYYYGTFFTHSNDKDMTPFAYHADANGWILFSPGFDRDYDIMPERDYDSSIPQPSPSLLFKTYDPTNGTISDGDIWRVKQ